MINIIIGLICVMISNILLGTSLAKLKKEFNKTKFLNGVFKVVTIVISIIAMYGCSYLNPNIMVANINGQEVNLISGMNLIFIAGIVYYGFNSLIKLKDILKLKIEINESGDKND